MVENRYKLFVAIDGNAIVHRAYHAYPQSLVTSQGLQVNAVFGFTVMLLEVLKKYDPHYIFCAFDTKKPTFRHTQFSDYKANRRPMDEGLSEQFPLVEEVVRALNIPIIKKEGFEADDVLGTVSKYVSAGKWSSDTIKMLLVSGDRDLLQLVNDKVNVCLPQGSFRTIKAFNRSEVFEKYQMYPEQIVEYKAIVGDASDNIPGVKGIGDKSAIELLMKYQNLEGIYKNIDEIKPRYKMLLTEGIEQAELSRDLATIKTDVNLSLKLEDCQTRDFRRSDVVEVFNKFEFRSLIEKIPQSNEKVVDDGIQYDLFGAQLRGSNSKEKVAIKGKSAIDGGEKGSDTQGILVGNNSTESQNLSQKIDQGVFPANSSNLDEHIITYDQIVQRQITDRIEFADQGHKQDRDQDKDQALGQSIKGIDAQGMKIISEHSTNPSVVINVSENDNKQSISITSSSLRSKLFKANEQYATQSDNYNKASKIILGFFNTEEYVGDAMGSERLIKLRFIYPQGYINVDRSRLGGVGENLGTTDQIHDLENGIQLSSKSKINSQLVNSLQKEREQSVEGFEVDVVMHDPKYVVDSFICFTQSLKIGRETFTYNWEEYISYILNIFYSVGYGNISLGYKKQLVKNISIVKDKVNHIFDIKLFAHLISSGKRDYSLSALVFDYLGGVFPKKVGENVDLNLILEIADKIKGDLHQLKIADLIAKRSDSASNKLSSLYPDCKIGNADDNGKLDQSYQTDKSKKSGNPDQFKQDDQSYELERVNTSLLHDQSDKSDQAGELRQSKQNNQLICKSNESSQSIDQTTDQTIELEQSKKSEQLNNTQSQNCVEKTALLIENRISCILAEMENRGLCVDPEKLEKLQKDLVDRINMIEQEVYYYVGHEFNINSPKQLSEVLFTHLNINTGAIIGKKKGKTGLSTREEILLELQDAHPIISRILEYRELNKMLTTYVDVLIKKSHESFTRTKSEYVVNTDFKQIGTSSGRFSSVNPNLQNIPVKGDWSKRIREVFVPRKSYKYVSIDYSQIEFRVMADVSGDRALKDIFINRQDIHRATASKIFDKPEDMISNEERGRGKTLNFAVLYGLTPFGLSKQLKISQAEAGKYISDYFKKYSGVAEYIDKSTKEALVSGYVQSMFGRRRYIFGLDSKNRNIKSAAIREAINMPIQGSASDLMKIAMIAIDDLIIKKYAGKVFLLLQIHDEIILEVSEDILADFEKEAIKVMTEIVQLEVPLEVHFSSGDNMSELK